eukprot:TRINITY_DN23418_c0_g1_i1.p1 TRINITY_DN23418_c0_g1~~TRINITY_DN23418_c0_g1_i1.p1  ORF type:complete len:422 (+),score=64.71 TRINITY_DN23418_c0_g1_i1:24-1268(+)
MVTLPAKSLLHLASLLPLVLGQCPGAITLPKVSTAYKNYFDFGATIDVHAGGNFASTTGHCRGGSKWSGGKPKEPGLFGGGHSEKGMRQANQFGDGLWFCLEEPRTDIGCMSECELRESCNALERPDKAGKQECCLFMNNNVGDGTSGFTCFIKAASMPEAEKLQPNVRLNEGSDFSVTVVPWPFMTELHMNGPGGLWGKVWVTGLCFFWQWCDFKILGCDDDELYTVRAIQMEVLDPLTLTTDGGSKTALAYEMSTADGTYVGRTTALSFWGTTSLHIVDATGVQVAIILSEGNKLGKSIDLNVEVANVPVGTMPAVDTRLLSGFLAMQFRCLGWIGLFWEVLFVLLVVGALISARYYHPSGWLASYDSLRHPDGAPDASGMGLLSGGPACCTTRVKPQEAPAARDVNVTLWN